VHSAILHAAGLRDERSFAGLREHSYEDDRYARPSGSHASHMRA
jgi:hypothetical protein